MAKENGLGMTVTIDDSGGTGQDLSNDITNISFGTTRNLQDVTGLDVSSMERIALLADGSVEVSVVFNDATDMSHDVFKDIATNTATRTAVVGHSGQTLTQEVLFTGYSQTRAAGGELTSSAPGQLAATTGFGWT